MSKFFLGTLKIWENIRNFFKLGTLKFPPEIQEVF